MSPKRFFRELVLLGCTAGGATLGFAAGGVVNPDARLGLAFLGMAVCGAFADFCLNGRS